MLLPKKITDLTGRRFGKLVVTSYAGRLSGGRSGWLCSCDCGGSKIHRHDFLTGGSAISCGCFHPTRRHGMYKTPEYKAWRNIKDRCFRSGSKHFPDYGGRGITMSAQWAADFTNFYTSMGPRPSPAHSIDRIDNNGNYEPENCRWATALEQASNNRRSKFVTVDGREMTVSAAARHFGVNVVTFWRRLERGMSVQEASQPSGLGSWKNKTITKAEAKAQRRSAAH